MKTLKFNPKHLVMASVIMISISGLYACKVEQTNDKEYITSESKSKSSLASTAQITLNPVKEMILKLNEVTTDLIQNLNVAHSFSAGELSINLNQADAQLAALFNFEDAEIEIKTDGNFRILNDVNIDGTRNQIQLTGKHDGSHLSTASLQVIIENKENQDVTIEIARITEGKISYDLGNYLRYLAQGEEVLSIKNNKENLALNYDINTKQFSIAKSDPEQNIVITLSKKLYINISELKLNFSKDDNILKMEVIENESVARTSEFLDYLNLDSNSKIKAEVELNGNELTIKSFSSKGYIQSSITL